MENIKKSEGFVGQKVFVLPRDFLHQISEHPLVKPLYLTDVGYYPHALHHYRERKEGSLQNILIFCAGGKGTVTFSGKTRTLTKNMLTVIPERTPHSYGSDDRDPWTIYWIHFSGSHAGYFFEKISQDNAPMSVSEDKAASFAGLFSEVLNSIENGYTFENSIFASQLLSHLLGLIFFSAEKIIPETENNMPVEKIILFMKEHLDQNYSLQQFADTINLSPSHFSYLFKNRTGFSPVDYFIRLKIQKACQYLDLTDFKVNAIARLVGFSDPYYFSRSFYKVMHHSPSDYRKIKKG